MWYEKEKLVPLIEEIQKKPALWHEDMKLKYLSVRIDTRDGTFTLCDRDGNIVDIEHVKKVLSGSKGV